MMKARWCHFAHCKWSQSVAVATRMVATVDHSIMANSMVVVQELVVAGGDADGVCSNNNSTHSIQCSWRKMARW